MKYFILLATTALLTGCLSTTQEYPPVMTPQEWTSQTSGTSTTDAKNLKNWWTGFNDPTLNQLVELGLKSSPDRGMAKARLLEARGLKRAARSSLFPEIGLSGTAGRESSIANGVGDVYEAGFDASYELDLFGHNRNISSAADATVLAREADYNNASLSLVAEISRSYIEYRAFEKQAAIARKNLEAQQKTLDLINSQKELGEAPQLDVERAQGLVNTTKAEIPEFQRLQDNARLRLGVLTGSMPADILPIVAQPTAASAGLASPVLMAPAQVIAQRPDILAAAANLSALTDLKDAAIADIFPRVTLAGFYGVQDGALIDPTKIWSGAISAAVSLLNFGRIQGNIDAANAREMGAYELWRKTVLQAVADVETALTDYAKIQERYVLLQQAAGNAHKSLDLSNQLYKEGEISFLDVLDAQRTANNADSSVVTAEASQAEALIALYKSLGVY